MQKKNFHRGFSVIEMLMMISLFAVLASLIIVAVNPISRGGDAQNAERWSNVNALVNALYLYDLENSGKPPLGVEETAHEICSPNANAPQCVANGFVDLSLLVPKYVHTLPIDPRSSGPMGSGYSVSVDGAGKVTVRALNTENADIISISR